MGGMRGLQGSFPRLTVRLPSHAERRRDLLYSIVLLYNYRTATIGFNQINTVFRDDYHNYINMYGYDNIHRYFDSIVGDEDDVDAY